MFLAFYELCAAVSLDVLRHVSCGLGIRPSVPTGGGRPPRGDYDLDYFTPFHAKRDCDLQAKYYPRIGHASRTRQGVAIRNPQSAQNPGGVKVLRRKGARAQPLVAGTDEKPEGGGGDLPRLDTHKDLSTITLLAQDSMGGLEVWDDAKESFVAVPVLEDALLVNAGVFLEKWSGGLIEATQHRVRNVERGRGRCSIVFFAMPDHDARIEPLLQQDENPATDSQEGFLAGDLMPMH
ncbi:unnamed protein product [Phytomonas sp. Hart1]|nr:unnamed protein product [Phytomonas sp. Hart1]|eukprot:CCW70909.1 unnamed protein product [Phytomonas sp. isolate Hart1]